MPVVQACMGVWERIKALLKENEYKITIEAAQ